MKQFSIDKTIYDIYRIYMLIKMFITPQLHHSLQVHLFWRQPCWGFLLFSAVMEPTFEVIVHQPEVEVFPGSEAKLGCSARGNLASVQRVEWTREGGELPPG